MIDIPYAYGVHCTWHGPLLEAISDGKPCCPYCGKEALVRESEGDFYQWVADTYYYVPKYLDFVKWTKGKCIINLELALTMYCAYSKVKISPQDLVPF
jgi:hypothetical protein